MSFTHVRAPSRLYPLSLDQSREWQTSPSGRRFSGRRVFPSGVVTLLVAGSLLGVPMPGHAGSATIADGTSSEISALRGLEAGGPRETRWGTQPKPYKGNLADHEGRAAGTYEDGSRGRVSGKVLADDAGSATIVVRDLKDTKANGKLLVTSGGETTRLKVEQGANGNSRTITLTGLAAKAWNDFSLLWSMGSRSPNKRDGYSVCRS